MKREDFELIRSFEDKLFLGLRVDYFDVEPEPEPEPESIATMIYDSSRSSLVETAYNETVLEPIIEEKPEPKPERSELEEKLAELQNALKELKEEEPEEVIIPKPTGE